MIVAEHTVKTKAKPEKIWSIWQDVENWNSWDHEIEYSRLDGPFKKGSTGVLKPKGSSEVPFEMTYVEPLKGYVDVSKLPLATLTFTHSLKQSDEYTYVTHKVEMHGFFAFFFNFIIGRKIKSELPGAMKRLVAIAENNG